MQIDKINTANATAYKKLYFRNAFYKQMYMPVDHFCAYPFFCRLTKNHHQKKFWEGSHGKQPILQKK